MDNHDIQLKRMRDIQLGIADVLLDFCKNNGLSIWAGYGTLLGAVRHRGFIPWDDDMDFVMLRKDFDRLRELALSIPLPYPLEFDCNRVDVIKVKNCATTQIAVYKISKKENYGIWVDIWCLDSMPRELSRKKYNQIRTGLRIVSNATQMSYFDSSGLSSTVFHTYCLLHTWLFGNKRLFDRIERLIKEINGDALVNIMVFSRLRDNVSYDRIKKYDPSWFSKTIELPFENRLFPCPSCYHEVLSTQYGDYMIPVKGSAVHKTTILDIDRPYREVVQEILTSLPWYKRLLREL